MSVGIDEGWSLVIGHWSLGAGCETPVGRGC
jgi:hypothetical protein